MKKIKVIVELEVNVKKGLNEIANTIHDVVETSLESGLDDKEIKGICKIMKISSDDEDISLFYESGNDYTKGISYKNLDEYLKRYDT